MQLVKMLNRTKSFDEKGKFFQKSPISLGAEMEET